MDIAQVLLVAAPTALFTGGVAWGTVKVTLNGTKARVEKLEEAKDDHTDRLARIETKIDILLRESD